MKISFAIRLAALLSLSFILPALAGCNSNSEDAAVKEEAPKPQEKPRVKSKGQESASENMFGGSLNSVEQQEVNKVLKQNARSKEESGKKIFGVNPFKKSTSPSPESDKTTPPSQP